jgi:hypothetical protein
VRELALMRLLVTGFALGIDARRFLGIALGFLRLLRRSSSSRVFSTK